MSIVGKNTELLHEGKRYHIQTESWEPKEPVLVSQVFCSGQVVYQKKHRIKPAPTFNINDLELAHTEVLNDIRGLLV